jgi:protein gp37
MNLRCTEEGAGIGNGLAFFKVNESKVRFVLDSGILNKIIRGRAPAGSRVFVGDMTDLFHPMIPFAFLDWVWAAMTLRPDLIFMVLSKRLGRALEYLTARQAVGNGPLPNLQLFASVEDQKTADVRIPLLLRCRAAVRGISYEPALGPVDFTPWLESWTDPTPNGTSAKLVPMSAVGVGQHGHYGLDGIIAGGESGPNARSAKPEWFRSCRDQCAEAGLPFFFKNWGDNRIPVYSSAGASITEKHGGRVLDGRTHDDLPTSKGSP